MPEVEGANTEDLRRLADAMQQAAGRLQEIHNAVGAQLMESTWKGHDADEFRRLWNYTLAGRLASTVSEIDGASSRLRQEASQQDQASGVTTGSGNWAKEAASIGFGAASTFLTVAEGIAHDPPALANFVKKHGLDGLAKLAGKVDKELAKLPETSLAKTLKSIDELDPIKDLSVVKDVDGLAEMIGKVGHVGAFAVIATVTDGSKLVYDFLDHKDGYETVNDGVSTSLDVAGAAVVATNFWNPIGWTVLAVGAAWAVTPESWHIAIEHGIVNEVKTMQLSDPTIEDAGGPVMKITQGGSSSVNDLLHPAGP